MASSIQTLDLSVPDSHQYNTKATNAQAIFDGLMAAAGNGSVYTDPFACCWPTAPKPLCNREPLFPIFKPPTAAAAFCI